MVVARGLSGPERALPCPLAAFRRRGARLWDTSAEQAWAEPRDAGARRIRPGDHLGAAGRRRRPGLALSRTPRPARRSGAPKAWRSRRCGMFEPGLFRPTGDPLRADAREVSTPPGCWPRRSRWRRQSAGRPRRPRGAAAPAGPGVGRPGGLFDVMAAREGLFDHLATLGPAWLLRQHGRCWRRWGRSGRAGLSLGGVPLGDCWRHPRDPAQRPYRRARADPQAFAVAGLFADRAAGGARGSR